VQSQSPAVRRCGTKARARGLVKQDIEQDIPTRIQRSIPMKGILAWMIGIPIPIIIILYFANVF
jgi:uncharacterized membrane protein YvbJ